jgi:hypothetical protein
MTYLPTSRDRLVADDAVRSARLLGVRVIETDGTRDAGDVAAIVAGHVRPYLPPPDDHAVGRSGPGHPEQEDRPPELPSAAREISTAAG